MGICHRDYAPDLTPVEMPDQDWDAEELEAYHKEQEKETPCKTIT